jgi:hypothetical protein
MKSIINRKLVIVLIILGPLIADLGCKKQPKCGCGKDVIFELSESKVLVYYSATSTSAQFIPADSYGGQGSSYYFCNPGDYYDKIKTYPQGQLFLVSGKAYYECNYLMNSGNTGYFIPPVYQVNVTALKEDNYGLK